MNPISRKIRLLLVPAIVLFAGGTRPVIAQSALDGFDPNANAGVRVVVRQPDGKILLGGDFTSLAPNGGPSVTRNHLARLNADGTLDTGFNPNANSTVTAIAVQVDGKILVGGAFTTIGGQPRNFMARLDGTTGLADSFAPNANNIVYAIAAQSGDKILVSGVFTSIGGQTRNHIARLDATTGLADSFDPNANDSVYAIAVQANGKILVGGIFTNIGGQTRSGMARVDPATGLADSFNPNANAHIESIAVQADGAILVCGAFTTIGGATRNHVARLDPTSGLADSFDPNPNDTIVYAIAVQGDGKILVGGIFTSIGGVARNNIARLNLNGTLDTAFNPNANATVVSLAVQPDGKILLGGFFTNIGGTTRNNIARLETDGSFERTLNVPIANSSGAPVVSAIALQADGKFIIGGDFDTVFATTRKSLARFNRNGTLDGNFNAMMGNPVGGSAGSVDAIAVQPNGNILLGGAFFQVGGQTRNFMARVNGTTGAVDSFNPQSNNAVETIALQADGKILAGGFFSGANSIGGQARNRIARLDPNTGLADSFNPNANDGVLCLAVQTDGKILVVGNFTTISGQTRNHIARLDPSTGLPDSFNPDVNNLVGAVAVQADGKILVGGDFTAIGGQTRNRIARLNSDGSLDPDFNPNANTFVSSIVVQADGKILVAGNFMTIGGQTRNRIARLDPATGLADSFDANANNTVMALAVQEDGKILAGGRFNGVGSIGGQTRSYLARLTNDTAAQRALTVSRTVVSLTRGGSSPHLTRVVFEDSADDVTYNFLGSAVFSGGNWTLDGLNLSIGQNFYIRARGYYRSGADNASESTADFVRNVFLTLPPQPTQVVSRKVHGAAGPFDINLPLSAAPGIECRSGGANNDYQLVFTFPSVVTFNSAAVRAGNGSVNSSSGNGTSGITLNLTSVTNAQKITITLAGLNDGTNTGDLDVQMGVLIGDTNGNGSVNASDVSQTKAQSGSPLTASNFRQDVNTNGAINASDVSLVKTKSGTALP
jgi:uncharacterized delta-60 repeat protein